METWMDELEKAVRRAPETDEDEDDGYAPADNGDEGEAPLEKKPPMGKCAKGVDSKGRYPAADNGDDETEGDVGVHNPDDLEDANNNTGKKQKLFPKNKGGVKKSLAENVDGDVNDAIEVSDILQGLTKGIDALANSRDTEIRQIKSEISQLSKGLQLIGKALVKSLEDSNTLVKSLKDEVDEMGRQPAPRKSTVRRVEKSFGKDQRTEFPSKEERLAKSMEALKAGKITPVDASMFESACNRGEFRTDIWRKMGGD